MNLCGIGLRTRFIVVLLTGLSLMGDTSVALGQTATVQKSMVQAKPGQSLGIASVPNLRDVGGLPTRDGGAFRTGLLYRSGALQGLDGADMLTFERLGMPALLALTFMAVAFADFKMGYACAMSWVLLLLVLAATAVILKTSARHIYYHGTTEA